MVLSIGAWHGLARRLEWTAAHCSCMESIRHENDGSARSRSAYRPDVSKMALLLISKHRAVRRQPLRMPCGMAFYGAAGQSSFAQAAGLSRWKRESRKVGDRAEVAPEDPARRGRIGYVDVRREVAG